MKKKILLSSILSIVLCLSLITGATMALFTSESKVNIAVSSGKVDVVATLGDLEYKTLTQDWQAAANNETAFDNIGGSAVVTNGEALTLTNIVPGDGVKVAVKIDNNSSVAIGYQINTAITGENAEELVIKITMPDGVTELPTGWQIIGVGASIEGIAVVIELPATATVQNVTANVEIAVTAIQANAAGGATLNGVRYETFAEAAEVAVNGDTINLGAGQYDLPAAQVAGKTLKIKGCGNETKIDFNKIYNVAGASLTFEDLYIEGKNSNKGDGYGIRHTEGEIKYVNCTINNCFTNEFNGTAVYDGCTFTGSYYVWTYSLKAATFTNCTFDRTDSRAILVYSHGNNPINVVVENCTFKAAAKGYTGTGAWTAAVEVDTTNIKTAGSTVTINNSTADANYSGLVRDKSSATATPALIKVDGEIVGTVNNKNLSVALANAAKGDTITLSAGAYDATAINGTLEDVTIQAEGEISTIKFNIGATANVKNVTFKNITVTAYEDSKSAYVDGGIFNIDAGATVENLVIEGGNFTGAGGRSCLVGCSETSADVVIKNCTVDGVKYLVYASAPNKNIVVEGCTIKNIGSWIILFNGNDGVGTNVTITGNTFENCTGGIAKSLGSSWTENANFVFTNNVLDAACVGHDGSDAKWFAVPAEQDQITVSGNTLGGNAWDPATAQGLGK